MRPSKESPPVRSNANETRKQFLLSALDRYERPLTAYALRLTNGDLHRARDAVQHAYMQLCKQAVDDVEPKLAPWLYTVCRNQILDERKSSFRQKSSPVNFEAVDRNATDPADRLEVDEVLQCLKGLFRCLHESEREAIELWAQGLDANEIGEILDKKPGTIRVNLHRAIKRLKQHPQVSKWLERATGQVIGPDVFRTPDTTESPPLESGTRFGTISARNGKTAPTIRGEQL